LSERWDEIVNWEKRKESEDGFFETLLKDYGVIDVLDIACGTGFHAIHLAKEGFNVKATDGSDEMLAQARANAGEHNVELEIGKADWLTLTKNIDERYDAVICLGNALTHLFYREYYQRAINEVYRLLHRGGIFVVDQRNYDAILDKGYTSKHKYYYCGEEIEIHPVTIQDDLVEIEYKFSAIEKYYLSLHPIRRDILTRYLFEAGFDEVRTYGDFEEEFEPYEPDFLIHVAEKK